jgi:hypothetical protein
MATATEGGGVAMGFLERHRGMGVVAVLALLVLVACSCVCLQVTGRIGQVPHPTPAFPIEDLLLDESAFPEGWRADAPFDPEWGMASEETARHFHTSKCHPLMVGASHGVNRFSWGADSAAEAYPEQIAIWFSPNWGEWSVPPQLSYESGVADQYRLGCYYDEDSHCTRCQAMAQYGEYIVLFSAHFDPDHPECLTFTDLEWILLAIDERMALYLGKEAQ